MVPALKGGGGGALSCSCPTGRASQHSRHDLEQLDMHRAYCFVHANAANYLSCRPSGPSRCCWVVAYWSPPRLWCHPPLLPSPATLQGLVKLADFGVAAKLGELEERNDELRQNVVGTPYWMAPEVRGSPCRRLEGGLFHGLLPGTAA